MDRKPWSNPAARFALILPVFRSEAHIQIGERSGQQQGLEFDAAQSHFSVRPDALDAPTGNHSSESACSVTSPSQSQRQNSGAGDICTTGPNREAWRPTKGRRPSNFARKRDRSLWEIRVKQVAVLP